MYLSYYVYVSLENGDNFYSKMFKNEREAYLYLLEVLKDNFVKSALLFERKERCINLKLLKKRYSND